MHVDTFLRHFLPYRIATMMNGGRERMGEGKFCTLQLWTKILVHTVLNSSWRRTSLVWVQGKGGEVRGVKNIKIIYMRGLCSRLIFFKEKKICKTSTMAPEL